MRNIMIISQSLTGGGAEKLAANLSMELSKTDHVTIVTFKQDEQEYEYAGERININRVGGKGGLIQHVVNAIGRINDVHKIKKVTKCECCISFLPQTDYVNILSKTKGEKTIIDVVSNMSFVYKSGLQRLFRKYIMKHADYVVTVSEGVRDDLIKNFEISETRSKTIYNSCDIAAIQRDCREEKEYQRLAEKLPKHFICSMGSFRMPKGHWHLIKAYASIARDIPDYKLVILGDGQYREKYHQLIEKLGITDRVVLPGFASPPYSVIAHSDLFVFSSVFEGFGHSIIEAITCGVPVLSTDCDYGAREIISPSTDFRKKSSAFERGEYGYLLPPFTMEDIDCEPTISDAEIEMGQGILKVLNENNSALIDCGLKYVSKFDNVAYGRYWKKVIEAILNE